ncbi:hypothetical protein ACFXKJ_16675 [Kitasatospora indigofera]|uniref:hypothetical protein n=1 Tax=Kitasatospora indigofera TaxID=67307 RepID=UPI0036CB99F9
MEPAAGRLGVRVLPGGAGGDRLDLRRDPDEEVGEAQDDVNIATALLVCALVAPGSAEAVELWVPELTGALSMVPVPQADPATSEAGAGEGRPGAWPGWGPPALRAVDSRGRSVLAKRYLHAYLYAAARAAAATAATPRGQAAAVLVQWSREQEPS